MISTAQLSDLAVLVERESGLRFREEERWQLEAAVVRVAARAEGPPGSRVSGPREVREGRASAHAARLLEGTCPIGHLLEELTVHESHFFRDRAHFDLARGVIAERLRAGAVPRTLSAGCAAGEEAYSLGILLEEVGAPAEAVVVAFDLSAAAIERARAAEYRPWALRGVSEVERAAWFVQKGQRWVVDARVRRRVVVEQANLLGERSALPRDHFDLIFCRNVLLYLSQRAITRVVVRLFEALAPGGVLVTGPSDPEISGLVPLDVEPGPAGLLYRRPGTSREPRPELEEPAAAPSSRVPPTPSQLAPVGSARVSIDAIRELSRSADPTMARAACAEARRRAPLDPELCWLEALFALGAGSRVAALEWLRRALYLDRSLAVVHYTLGTVLEIEGSLDAARRSYRSASRLVRALPSGQPLPLSEGETAGVLAREAERALVRLGCAPGTAGGVHG